MWYRLPTDLRHSIHLELTAQSCLILVFYFCSTTALIASFEFKSQPLFHSSAGISSHSFHTSSSHALEAALVSLVDLGNLVLVLLELIDKLGGVKLAVGSTSLDDLGLLVQCKVLPGEVWSDVLLEEGEDLVVGDSTGVGEVVDSGVLVLGHEDGGWEEIVEDGVGVGDVDDTLVLGDLGDEVTGVEVIADWHAESEDQAVAVVLHDLRIVSFCQIAYPAQTHLLNVCLGFGVERAIEVGLVSLEETWATNRVGVVVGIDTASGKDSDVNALLVTAIGQVNGTDNVVSDGLLLVVLAPVNVGSASRSSSIEDVGWLVFVELSDDSFSVLHADGGREDLLACGVVSWCQCEWRQITYPATRGGPSSYK